jgi:hypothetical protein
MQYRQYTETKIIATGITWGTSKQTVSLRIPQSRRRLEGIIIEPIFLTPAGAPTATSDGFANIFSEVRLRVNDVLGSRNAIQCPSTVLLNFNESMGGAQSRHNLFGERPVTAAKNYRLHVPVMVRQPCFEEPVGNIFGIPLDQLNEDPVLEIDIDSNASTASANPSVSIPAIRAVILYRDVDPAVKYMPTELISSRWTIPATGKQSFDVATGGFLTALMMDQYSTFATTRALLYTANDHEFQIELGSNKVMQKFPTIMDGLLDNQNGSFASATPFFTRVAAVDTSATDVSFSGRYLGNYIFDFMYDDSKGGAFSPASILNANPIPLGGDRVKMTGTNYSAVGTVIMTHHKLLTRSAGDLAALMGI